MKITWTVRASKNLDKIHYYLEAEWSLNSVKKFNRKLLKFLELLQEKPEIGKAALLEKNIRAFVLTRHNTLFYRVKQKNIIILQIFDNRMYPEKILKKERELPSR